MERIHRESEATLHQLKNTHGYVYTGKDELTKVMTGQEWYSRFKSLLTRDTKKVQHQCIECGAPYNWYEAAKKAAGLEDA